MSADSAWREKASYHAPCLRQNAPNGPSYLTDVNAHETAMPGLKAPTCSRTTREHVGD